MTEDGPTRDAERAARSPLRAPRIGGFSAEFVFLTGNAKSASFEPSGEPCAHQKR